MKIALVLAVAAAGLAACDTPTAPEAVQPSFSANGVAASATGFGRVSASNRRFAFSAIRKADGSVNGQYQLVTGAGIRIHGTVTCVTVVGNVARVGGIADPTNAPGWAGIRTYFTVVDNGEGSSAPSDRISFLHGGGLGPVDEIHCDAGHPWVAANLAVDGNVQVR